MDNKKLINSLYDGAVLTGLTIANSYILNKTLSITIEAPKNATSIKKFGILALAISGAVLEKQYLDENNILPIDPYK